MNTFDSLHSYLHYPEIYCSKSPTEEQQDDCKLFLRAFRQSLIRAKPIEEKLDEVDNYFHFGNPNRETLDIKSFTNKVSKLNLTSLLADITGVDSSVVIKVFKSDVQRKNN